MPKKKHRKKVRSSKRAAPRKATTHAAPAKRSKKFKRSKRRLAHATSEGHSLSLLRAIKRRREAEQDRHHQPHASTGAGHHARKAGAHHLFAKRGHHTEPVITEKSFANMLAYRRFQNHAR